MKPLVLFSSLLLLYFTFHSLLAAPKVKSWLKAHLIPKPYYRLFYNTMAVLLLVPAVITYILCPKVMAFENNLIIQMIGGPLFLIGLVLMIIALRQYNLREFSGLAQLEGDEQTGNELITDGLNAYVRHPLYFASLLQLWGAFLFLPYTVHLVLALTSSTYLVVGSMLEERKLVKVFGKAYRQYQREVPMLLPWGPDRKK